MPDKVARRCVKIYCPRLKLQNRINQHGCALGFREDTLSDHQLDEPNERSTCASTPLRRRAQRGTSLIGHYVMRLALSGQIRESCFQGGPAIVGEITESDAHSEAVL